MRDKKYWETMARQFDCLLIYRKLKHDEAIDLFIKMCETTVSGESVANMRSDLYTFLNILIQKAEQNGLNGDIWKKYILILILQDVNEFSIACETKKLNPRASIYGLALHDLKILQNISDCDLFSLCSELGDGEDIWHYSSVNDNESLHISSIVSLNDPFKKRIALQNYYESYGCGDFACGGMYKIDSGEIIPVSPTDTVTFDDIIGYEKQKLQLKLNTEAFLAGQPANNTLLTGTRGTGKSSCVKALLNTYKDKGLRLIEIEKEQVHYIPSLLTQLKDRGKYFIFFMDDLSFDAPEIEYKHLKSLLEGGVQTKPKNVLFYATSNRRHIVQEKWSDKNKEPHQDEEIHSSDSINEKLSLSDRFGIVVNFTKPTPEEYVKIVLTLAKKYHIAIPEDTLQSQCLSWELNQNGLSGRTARQFITYLLGAYKKILIE